MTPSKAFLFTLDALLLLLGLLLMSPRLTGLALHEWIGIAFLLPLLVHLLMSWRWIVTALRRALAPACWRDAANLALNTMLFISTTVVVVSGLVISQVALPWLGVGTIDDRTWRTTHNNWTDAMWLFVCAHVAMNWRWIAKVADRYIPKPLKEL
jgi:cytochrome b561